MDKCTKYHLQNQSTVLCEVEYEDGPGSEWGFSLNYPYIKSILVAHQQTFYRDNDRADHSRRHNPEDSMIK